MWTQDQSRFTTSGNPEGIVPTVPVPYCSENLPCWEIISPRTTTMSSPGIGNANDRACEDRNNRKNPSPKLSSSAERPNL